ncbi:MAG: FadR family transcriptional regulator [Deltaproteobacteria bacterium]|nr:FadR family transcriptional regulator [Deltaproteobacteria bacterium]MBW2081891.1 FadR family transcriptional regulator [Deltaproteobacteria bacterium]HDM09645.1 FadR family transcriptional regulator [Desulfobacteraceae bacterium]
MFKPAKRNRVFQDIVEQIQEHILSGELKEGDFLPSERDLQELFQVSRGTIREALRVLEQKGLVEIKLGVGGGAMIRTASVDKVTESLALLIRHQKISLDHLSEFREGFEGDIAALAAERAKRKDLEGLEKILETARTYAEAGQERASEFLETDKDFHLALARITRNPIYEAVERIVQENIFSYYETLLYMGDRRLKENYEDLRKIVAAIKEKNIEKARALARNHVARFTKYMRKKERQE